MFCLQQLRKRFNVCSFLVDHWYHVFGELLNLQISLCFSKYAQLFSTVLFGLLIFRFFVMAKAASQNLLVFLLKLVQQGVNFRVTITVNVQQFKLPVLLLYSGAVPSSNLILQSGSRGLFCCDSLLLVALLCVGIEPARDSHHCSGCLVHGRVDVVYIYVPLLAQIVIKTVLIYDRLRLGPLVPSLSISVVFDSSEKKRFIIGHEHGLLDTIRPRKRVRYLNLNRIFIFLLRRDTDCMFLAEILNKTLHYQKPSPTYNISAVNSQLFGFFGLGCCRFFVRIRPQVI